MKKFTTAIMLFAVLALFVSIPEATAETHNGALLRIAQNWEKEVLSENGGRILFRVIDKNSGFSLLSWESSDYAPELPTGEYILIAEKQNKEEKVRFIGELAFEVLENERNKSLLILMNLVEWIVKDISIETENMLDNFVFGNLDYSYRVELQQEPYGQRGYGYLKEGKIKIEGMSIRLSDITGFSIEDADGNLFSSLSGSSLEDFLDGGDTVECNFTPISGETRTFIETQYEHEKWLFNGGVDEEALFSGQEFSYFTTLEAGLPYQPTTDEPNGEDYFIPVYDTRIEIKDLNGIIVHRDDDSNGMYEHAIFVPQYSGEYEIVVKIINLSNVEIFEGDRFGFHFEIK